MRKTTAKNNKSIQIKAAPKRPSRAPLKKPNKGSTGERIRSYARSIGQGLGAWTGVPGAGTVGNALGDMAGGFLSKITGHGKYTIRKNEVWEGNANSTFTNTGDGVVLSHREFIGDITGSSAFAITGYPIQPCNNAVFPFLSTQALYYENWEPLGLVVEYVPTSGYPLNGASPAAGAVIIATEYNPAAPPFGTKQQMETYEYCTSGPPFSPLLHPIECAKGSNPMHELFTRTTSVTAASLPLYDLGNIFVATQGMPAAYIIGELWITYKVRLRKPRIPTTVGNYYHARTTATATAAAVFNGLTVVSTNGSTSTPFFTVAGNVLTFTTAGTYHLNIVFTGGANITTQPNVATNGGASLLSIFGPAGAFSQLGLITGVYSDFIGMISTPVGGTATISGLTGYATGTTDLMVMTVPQGLPAY